MSGHAQQVALAMARPSARRETLVQKLSGRGVMLPECGSLPVPRYLARLRGDDLCMRTPGLAPWKLVC